MKRYIIFYTLLMACLASTALFAQTTVTVTGTVIERSTNQPLIGVSVLQASPQKALAQTNANGRFTVTVPASAVLVFRYIGYNEQKVQLKAGQKAVTVYMSESKNEMDEVVIVAYQNRKKEDFTGSTQIISAKEIQDNPVANVEELLQGKVPGLNIQNNTGAPGFRGSVQIRGLSTLSVSGSGSESFLQPTSPLYIIDGVPIDADRAAEYGFDTQGPGVSPLSLIPQEDIANIQIMKDAQATSMYGSRGAYGVIIITTKRGNSSVPRVRYTSNFFIKTPPKLRETLGGNYERRLKIQQILDNATNIDQIWRMGETGFLADSLNAYWNNSTDWQSIFYRTTYNQTHNLALDGGDQRFNYKANLGYYDENGVIKNTGFSRYNLNMNMEFKPNNKFRFFGSMFGSVGEQKKGDGVGLLQRGVAANGQASTLLPPPSFYQASGGVLSALQTDNNNSTRNLRANVEGRYEFIPGLALASSISYDYTSDIEDTFTPAAANGQFARVYAFNGRKFTLYNRNTLTYAKTFGGNHNIFINTFTEMYKRKGQQGITRQEKSPNDQLQGPLGYDAFASRGGGVLAGYTNATIASFAGAVSYDYMKKYVVDLSYRLDGTSSNGLENPYSYNPSVGLRWNFDKEGWMENISWLDYGALRLTWGQNINPSGSLESIYGRYNLNGNFNNNPTIGIDFDLLPNPNLKPTTTTQYNFGVDLGLFNNRLDIVFDTYYKEVDNLLFDSYLSNISGFNKILSNDAGIANYGSELFVTVRPLPTASKFNWTFTLNGAYNTDRLIKLPAEYAGQFIRFDNSPYKQHTVFRVGRNTLSNYLRINQGVYSTDADVPVDPVTGRLYQTSGRVFEAGDPILKDVNGDYILDGADYEITGNSQPLITGGISTSLSYNNRIGLNVYASYTAKRTILNNALADRFAIMRDPFATRAVVPLDDMNMWRKPGDIAVYPYPYDFARYGDIQPVRPDQTLWAEEGSYLKINSVTLYYNFDRRRISQYGLNMFRVFFTVNNLTTFSGYSGPNPENVTNMGRDSSEGYPVPRTFNLGLNIELNTK